MKGKKIKRLVSIILTCAVIFCSLPLSGLVFADGATPYSVTMESPAIPMTENTTISLSDVQVEMSEGTYVPGADITWTSTDSHIKLSGNELTVRGKGTFLLNATYNGTTVRVYAVSVSVQDAAKGLYKFYDADFANGNYDPSEWRTNNIFCGTSTKNVFKTVEYNGTSYTVKDPDTSHTVGQSKTDYVVDENNDYKMYVAESKYQGNSRWDSSNYINGNNFYENYNDALTNGAVTSTQNAYVEKFGGFLPLYNGTTKETVKYYNATLEEDGSIVPNVAGGEMTQENESQSGGYFYTVNPIFNDFANYTVGTSVLEVGEDNQYKAFGIIGRVTYGNNYIKDFSGIKISQQSASSATYISSGKINHRWNNWFTYGRFGQIVDLYTDSTATTKATFTYLYNNARANSSTTEYATLTQKYMDDTITLTSGDGEQTVIVSSEHMTSSDSTGCSVGVQNGSIGIYSQMGGPLLGEMYAAINSEYLVNIPVGTAAQGYTVSSSSPAIPMNSLTYVKTEDLSIEIGGNVYNGTAVKFTLNDSTSNVEIKDGAIYAYSKGVYPLTATCNGESANVYVVVKDKTDTQWELYSETFGDYSNVSSDKSEMYSNEKGVAFPSNWKAQWYSNQSWHNAAFRYQYGDFPYVAAYDTSANGGTRYEAPGIVPFANINSNFYLHSYNGTEKVNFYGAPAFFVLNDAVVNNFADYTIISTLSNNVNNAYGDARVGSGLFGRVRLDENGKITKESAFTGSFANPHKGSVFTIEQKANTDASTYTTFKDNSDSNIVWNYIKGKNITRQKYALCFAGNTATLYSPDDSENQKFTYTADQHKGAVGVMTQMFSDDGPTCSVLVGDFKVVLNNAANDCPVAYEFEVASVGDASPAIPMDAFTYLDTKDFYFNIDGNPVKASNVTITVDNETDGVVIEDGKIYAYAKGLYPITVTSGSISKTFYVAVKNKADTQWELYSETFGDYSNVSNDKSEMYSEEKGVAFPSNWKAQWYSDVSWHKDAYRYQYGDFPYVAAYDTSANNGTRYEAPGIVPFSNIRKYSVSYNGTVIDSLYASPAYFVLNDSVVNNFSDYTVIATLSSSVNNYYSTSDIRAGSGLFGRAQLDENGKLTKELSTFTSAYVDSNNGKVFTKLKTANVDASPNTLLDDVWTYAKGAGKTAQRYALRYEDKTATLYSPDDSNNQKITFSASQQKGGVGVTTMMFDDGGQACSVLVKDFKVCLNDTTALKTGDISIYEIPSYDPVLVMNVGTQVSTKTFAVQFETGDSYVMASELTFDLGQANGIAYKDGKILAYKVGNYAVTISNGTKSKTLYVLVKESGTTEIELFNPDLSSGVIDYNVFAQSELIFDNYYEVTSQKDITLQNYDTKISRIGIIPFVTTQYWDAITLNGERTYGIDGAGYNWIKIFQNKSQYFFYVKEDYITSDGIKLSDLGNYKVSVSGKPIDLSNSNIKQTANGEETRMEYNLMGVMGRVNVNGTAFSSASTKQSFGYYIPGVDFGIVGDGVVKANNNQTGYGLTNNTKTVSFSAVYQDGKISGDMNGTYSIETDATPTTGTVGITSKGRDFDIFGFAVTYPVTDMPQSDDITLPTTNNTISVVANTVTDLSQFTFNVNGESVSGRDVVWSASSCNIGEFDVATLTYAAFAVGTDTLNISYNGNTAVVTVNVVANATADTVSTGTYSIVDVQGNGAVVITPTSVAGKYTVTVNGNSGYLLDAGIFQITEDGTKKDIYLETANTATVYINDMTKVIISAKFVKDNEISFKNLGATIRLADKANNIKSGIRFGTRLNNIKKTDTNTAKYDTVVEVNGVEYTMVEAGGLLIPTVALKGKELTFENLDALGMTSKAQSRVFKSVANTTPNYSDAVLNLVGFTDNESRKTVDISYNSYVKYADNDGNEYVVYSDTIERNYNELLALIPATSLTTADADRVSLILTSNKANLKYAANETVVVYVDTYVDGHTVSGATVNYNVYAGDNNGYSGSAIQSGTLISTNKAASKINVKTTSGYYYVVTDVVDKDGNIIKRNQIRIGSGLSSADPTAFDENNIAFTSAIISDTHIYSADSHYNNKHLEKTLKVINNFAGYYSDGTQKLDAVLLAGDMTNSISSPSNVTSVANKTNAEAQSFYQGLIYDEANALRNLLSNGLGSSQLVYAFGNHDSSGNGVAQITKPTSEGNYNFAPVKVSNFYASMFGGWDGTDSGYDYTSVDYNQFKDTANYVRYFGKDLEETAQFEYGNRLVKINGYYIISIEPTSLLNGVATYSDYTKNFLRNALDKAVSEDPTAPIFVISHYRAEGSSPYDNDGRAVGISEILNDYPQVISFGGHTHESALNPTMITQFGTAGKNGFTSINTNSTSYQYGNYFYMDASDNDAARAQIVQVDINGNTRITRIIVDSSASTISSSVADAAKAEITLNEYGQYVQSSDNAVSSIATVNTPWVIQSAQFDPVRDTYSNAVRAAKSHLEFTGTADDITVSGNTIKFKRAKNVDSNGVEVISEDTAARYYKIDVYLSSGSYAQTKWAFSNCSHTQWTDFTENDTYTVTADTSDIGKVVIQAYDAFEYFRLKDSDHTPVVIEKTIAQ